MFVEETVRNQHSLSPEKPIYLVGDSFGGCLALAVAARNPKIDLVLILANPGRCGFPVSLSFVCMFDKHIYCVLNLVSTIYFSNVI